MPSHPLWLTPSNSLRDWFNLPHPVLGGAALFNNSAPALYKNPVPWGNLNFLHRWCWIVESLDVLNRGSRFTAIWIATGSQRFQIARFESQTVRIAVGISKGGCLWGGQISIIGVRARTGCNNSCCVFCEGAPCWILKNSELFTGFDAKLIIAICNRRARDPN